MKKSAKHLIPSSYSRELAQELGLQERDLHRLLLGTGLSTSFLLPEDGSAITDIQQLKILDNARSLASSPELGLALGQRLRPSSHGPLGQLTLSSPDLLTALELLCDFLPIRLPILDMSLQINETTVHCTAKLRPRTNNFQKRLLHECYIMLIQSVAESVLGRALTEAHFQLAHAQPDYASKYSKYLHSPISFANRSTAVVIPIGIARQRNVACDAESYALAQKLCQQLLASEPKVELSTADRVRHLLLSTRSSPVSETEVSNALFISKRTLARRLAAENTGFRQIREQVLADMALHHIQQARLSVASIANLLGYSDSAAFRKAFRRWFRASPSEMRRKH